jgi:hypothetical protein
MQAGGVNASRNEKLSALARLQEPQRVRALVIRTALGLYPSRAA